MSIIEVIDWIWDLRREEKLHTGSFVNMADKQLGRLEDYLKVAMKEEEVVQVDENEWAHLEDLGDGTLILILNVKEGHDPIKGESKSFPLEVTKATKEEDV